MLEISRSEKISAVSVEADDGNNNLLNYPEFLNASLGTAPENVIFVSNSTNPDTISTGKSIFVCTFCQVFSSTVISIADHINSVHKASLPLGTIAENFVSKLQALQNENQKKCAKKVGRPRKIPPENLQQTEKKLPDPEPLPGPDGLYWCKKCLKHFKKPRQLSRHVCLEIEEDEILNESSEESDNSGEFRTYMDIEPTPWQRIPKHSRKEVEGGTDAFPEGRGNRIIPNWRDDPSYVPLFGSESEKLAFEKHLKSIDYSSVDNLFVKEEKRIKGRRKKTCLHNFKSIYSCMLCKKVLNSLTHIRMHCLTHTEMKPFTCSKCPYRCNTKGSLYTHMRNHTGNVFRCSKCDFQCIKRAHLLDHEETHSSVPQWCKLCKNSYKTLKSLIAHIKKYHNNPGGKKYVKLLSSKNHKDVSIKCNICPKKFTSQSSFDIHNRRQHPATTMPPATEKDVEIEKNLRDSATEMVAIAESPFVPISASDLEYQNEIVVIKDPLADIVLNNLLQQKNAEAIEMYEDVFQQSPDPNLLASTDSLDENYSSNASSHQRLSPLDNNQYNPSKSVLEVCDKTLSLEILDECLRDPKFADEVISESYIPKSGKSIPGMLSQLNVDLVNKNNLNETKTDEIQLFEKCRRAPAYVCCVCSGIFICPSTLKAHLKEHLNTTSKLIEEAAEDFAQEKMAESSANLDNVCQILQDPTNSCTDDEKELEKLYTSSLDMIWYLPEVSVVLENDPALFDAVLDDIYNFPITDKFDDTEDMDVKCPEMF